MEIWCFEQDLRFEDHVKYFLTVSVIADSVMQLQKIPKVSQCERLIQSVY